MENYKDIIVNLKNEFNGDNISDIIHKAIREGERIEKERQEKSRVANNNKKINLQIVPTEIIQTVQKSPLDEEVIQALYNESLITANLASSLQNKTLPQWIQDYFKKTPSSIYTTYFLGFYQQHNELDTEPADKDRKNHIAKIIAYMIDDIFAGENSDYNYIRNIGKKKFNSKSMKDQNYHNRYNDEKVKEIDLINDILAPIFNVDPKDIKYVCDEVKDTRNDIQYELKNLFNDIFKDFDK